MKEKLTVELFGKNGKSEKEVTPRGFTTRHVRCDRTPQLRDATIILFAEPEDMTPEISTTTDLHALLAEVDSILGEKSKEDQNV